ncbi:MAG: hypothetical protein IMZ53_01160 [Thermoplasmata archaeon]|nr:hypothetical protein [Thermoplasmata archaeon]
MNEFKIQETEEYKIFRSGYIAGRALSNPKYEFDYVSELSCIRCFENRGKESTAFINEKPCQPLE